MEFTPNGSIFNNDNKINPADCIGNKQGSISVSDNGNIADDAFAVVLDGVTLGSTQIGAANTFSASNLRTGSHTLKVTCIVAPDDDGTLQISLGDGLTFEGGYTDLSAELAQGESVSYTIIVP